MFFLSTYYYSSSSSSPPHLLFPKTLIIRIFSLIFIYLNIKYKWYIYLFGKTRELTFALEINALNHLNLSINNTFFLLILQIKNIGLFFAWSRIKWCRTSICLVWERWIALYITKITLVSSHLIDFSGRFRPKSLRCWTIHNTCEQQTTVAIMIIRILILIHNSTIFLIQK